MRFVLAIAGALALVAGQPGRPTPGVGRAIVASEGPELVPDDRVPARWRGHYGRDHETVELASGTFVHRYMSCAVSEYRGRAVWQGETVTLEPDDEGFQWAVERACPIAWGARRYLVPVNEMVRFMNDVHGGCEPRGEDECCGHRNVFLHFGDSALPVSGAPDLPADWSPFLLAAPIEAELVDMDAGMLRVEAGWGHGLWKGMQLHATCDAGPHRRLFPLTVVEVDCWYAWAKPEHNPFRAPGSLETFDFRGVRVSTRRP